MFYKIIPSVGLYYLREMDLYKNHYYKINWFFLSSVGLWPYQNKNFQLLTRVFIIIIAISVIFVQLTVLLVSEYNLNSFVEVLPSVFACMGCMTKYFNCWINNEVFKKILEDIEYDWTDLKKSKSELDILKKYARSGKLYAVYYAIMIYSGVTAFVVAPVALRAFNFIMLSNESHTFQFHPLKTEYFVDDQKYFYPILIHLDVSAFVLLTILIANDITFIRIVMHACAIFSVLGHKIQRTFDLFIQDTYNNDSYRSGYLKIIEFVELHERVWKYLNNVESCYSVSFIVLIMITIMSLAILLVYLFEMLKLLRFNEVIFCVLHITTHAFVVFLNMTPGQELINHSSKLFRELYYGCWYFAPVELQRMLLLIMQKVRKPRVLTSGRILQCSFETYGMIIQTAMSYFTVLYSVR